MFGWRRKNREQPPYPPSPVPSDADLPPGVKPFTAFGQFGEGRMDSRVFEQDVYWVNLKGQPFRLEEMPEDYRYNVIAFLHSNVEYFHARAAMREVVGIVEAVESGLPHGDLIAMALGAPGIAEMPPQAWLESTPLMRRLRRLTPGASGAP